MSTTKRAVFLKQSGELLEASGDTSHWGAAQQVAKNIALAYRGLGQQEISGLSIVPGAGNIARGDRLRSQGLAAQYADVIGRWGTIGNALVLAGALESLDIPVQLLLTDKMAYRDNNFEIKSYSPAAVLAAHQAGKVVVLAGGCGQDNVTTDFAVTVYAREFATVFDGDIVVLKSTKFDGVYQADPAKNPHSLPPRYELISAQQIKDNYQQFKVVDKESLDQLIEGHLSMLVYSDRGHSLGEILSATAAGGAGVGTLIVPTPQPARLSDN